jgi:hypothetical protein
MDDLGLTAEIRLQWSPYDTWEAFCAGGIFSTNLGREVFRDTDFCTAIFVIGIPPAQTVSW